MIFTHASAPFFGLPATPPPDGEEHGKRAESSYCEHSVAKSLACARPLTDRETPRSSGYRILEFQTSTLVVACPILINEDDIGIVQWLLFLNFLHEQQ